MPALSPSRWIVALCGFLLGCSVTLAAVGGAYYALHRPAPAASSRTADVRPIYARAEFRRRVLGKGEAEVIDVVGAPDGTSEDTDAHYWHFKKRTRDPVTHNEDSDVQVVIQHGKVVAVNF